MRAGSDAILVGVGTVLADDPSLKVHWEVLGIPPGASPRRVILDSRGRTPPGARVLDGSVPTLIATGTGVTRAWPAGVEVAELGQQQVELPRLLRHLADLGVRHLMVEGGSTVLAAFLRGGAFDRLTVYVAPVVVGGATAPTMVGGTDLPERTPFTSLRQVGSERLGDGTLLTFEPR